MITWDSSLSVGIPSIDVQHQTMIALINELQEVIDADKPNVMVGSVLSKLIEYTHFHFDHEENCLITGCYNKFTDHKCQHDNIALKLKFLEQEYLQGKPGIALQVHKLMKVWLMEHIAKSDQQYGEQLVNAGLQ